MKTINEILKNHQNEEFEFQVCSNENSSFDKQTKGLLSEPHISNHYYFYYLVEGETSHQIDLDQHNLSKGELAFVCPNQIHRHQKVNNDNVYYELFFKEQKQFLLKSHLLFLMNPLNKNIINIPIDAQERISLIFKTLLQFQHSTDEYKRLKIYYLNILLEELNHIYISKDDILTNPSLNTDIETLTSFKSYISKHLTDQLSVETIANELGFSNNSLYKLVKKHTDKSPKEYINCLLITEAKRQLFYSKISTKELAYNLGFSDPSYFSKFFKKNVGKSIKQFTEDLSI